LLGFANADHKIIIINTFLIHFTPDSFGSTQHSATSNLFHSTYELPAVRSVPANLDITSFPLDLLERGFLQVSLAVFLTRRIQEQEYSLKPQKKLTILKTDSRFSSTSSFKTSTCRPLSNKINK